LVLKARKNILLRRRYNQELLETSLEDALSGD
jgi:hypothetical protein